MNEIIIWMVFLIALIVSPFLALGAIKVLKARLQNRIGPPIMQPVYDLIKLFKKGETVSDDASWLFRASCAINFAAMVIIAFLVPWLSFKPHVVGDDLFLVVYLFVLMRFFALLIALEPGSPFGAFGASREATLSLLVEPAVVLSLVALAVVAQTSSLGSIFDFTLMKMTNEGALWILSGCGLFLSGLVELSRMPVDDPNTHLELTMVHEAMILENSGRNLALIQITYALRLVVIYGLAAQCFLHAINGVLQMSVVALDLCSLLFIAALIIATAVIESVCVKLQWRKPPEFIAYALTMSLLATMVAIMRRV